MKIRLSWKLFGVMMFNVVLIVGVMVVIMNLFVSREFQGYIRANDLERFQNVKEGLQQYYSFYGSWEVLASSRGRWGRILNRIMMLNDPYQQPTLHSQHRKRYLQQRFLNQDKNRPHSSKFLHCPTWARPKKTTSSDGASGTRFFYAAGGGF